MLSSSGQKSQIIKRSTFLNQSQPFSITSRATTSGISETNEKKELRRYPTEWVEQIDNKSDNKFHHVILNKGRDEHNPNLASPSKIFGNQDQNPSRVHTQNEESLWSSRRKNQSLGNLGSWQFSSPQSAVKPNTSKSLSRRLDLAVPLSELLEISRQLDCAQPDDIRQLSRSYVNEMFLLSQTITRVLQNNLKK